MEPNTLRLQANTWESLAEEADELGYATRSEYLRDIIRHREAITDVIDSNTEPNTEPNTRVLQRLDELEERVAELETSGDPTAEAEPETTDEADESTETPEVTFEPSESDTGGEDTSEARVLQTDEAVARVAESWEDSSERLEKRRQAAEYVLNAALGSPQAIGKSSEIVDKAVERFPIETQSRETFYRKNIRPVLNEYGEYSQGAHGYVVNTLEDS